MSETENTPPPAATPEYRSAQRWNIVWVVPILALVLGAWMIYRHVTPQGPMAYVRFETAEGIWSGKTEVRCRSVRVGVVREVTLAEDLKSVLVSLELNADSDSFLRQGTSFWVVRPRASIANGISGLDTLLNGAYIELDPGRPTDQEVHHFDGLETPAATSRDIPGRRIILTAEEAGSLSAGSPLYYRGIEVGRIETRKFEIEHQLVTYDVFIRQEYSALVTENTRFWNASGIDIIAGADGLKVRTPSIEAIVSGGATFGVIDGLDPGKPIEDGKMFTLFSNEDDANQSTFHPTSKFVLLFDQSVRGLVRGAPVEFRGITIGRVADISFNYLKETEDSRIPVLIEIDLALLRSESAGKVAKPDVEFLKESVSHGLRAALKAANLLTGALYVDLDYHPDVVPAVIATVGDYSSFPTISSGLAQLETKVTAVLDKIQALPMDDAVKKLATAADEASSALKEIKETVASARKTLDSPEFTQLPADLRNSLAAVEKSVSSVGPDGAIQGDLLRTLDELRAALRSIKTLTNGLDEKPNSIIFGRDSSGNPIPKAPKPNR